MARAVVEPPSLECSKPVSVALGDRGCCWLMVGLGALKGHFQPPQSPGSVLVPTPLGKILFHPARGRAVAAQEPPSKRVKQRH